MSLLNRTLAAALIAGGASSLAGSAGAVPLSASIALRDASTPAVQQVRWGRRWGGFGLGLAAGAIIGGALARPYYGYGYGYGYAPAYYGYGYGYPAYGYGYAPSYSYGYAPAYYGYAYAYPRYYGYRLYPRYRYRGAYWRRW